MFNKLIRNQIPSSKSAFMKNTNEKFFLAIMLTMLYLLTYIRPSFAQTNPVLKQQAAQSSTISLFASAGSGDYYTLYPDGLKKEEAYIGGFKSVQLDPLEENIYFFDPILKVIGKINLQSGKVYKVIGKPKNSTNVDYSSPVSFNDANLSKLADFIFDKYGNIFILYNNNNGEQPSDPVILKASFRDNTIKQVLKVEDQFKTDLTLQQYYKFSLTNLSYDYDKSIYLYGSYTPGQNPQPNLTGPVIIKFDTLSNAAETYGLGNNLLFTGYPYKLILNPNGLSNFSVKSFYFDKSDNSFICSGINNAYSLNKISSTLNSDGVFNQDSFIGDGSASDDDIGDGGQAKSAFAVVSGAKCLCGDKNGDTLIADIGTNRIRRVYKSSGLINTVIGGGEENLVFGEKKSLKSIYLQLPTSLLVDKLNNLYVVEPNRILITNNIVTYVDHPVQYAKIANLSISKVAGNQVDNPSGDINIPDLSLDYSFAGNQTVEVTSKYIPDGTTVKLVTTNADGSISADKPSAKIASGIASIPVKIDAGTSKVIKAETDPFIPAPGVYLSGSEPMIAPGTLPEEPASQSQNRDAVNLTTKNSEGVITGNLISSPQRFNFLNSGWKKYQDYTEVKLNAAPDPDDNLSDSTLVNLGPSMNLVYLDLPNSIGKVTFSVWIRTADNSDFFLPIGFSKACPDRNAPYNFSNPGWETCNMQPIADQAIPGNYKHYSESYQVTSAWRKITLPSNFNLDDSGKIIVIGGGAQPVGKKIYLWGARLERQ